MWEKRCLNCGIDILEFLERRARESQERAEAAAQARAQTQRRKWRLQTTRSSRRFIALGALAGLGVALFLASRPAALPPGAIGDSAGLSFVAPAGWSVDAAPAEGWRFTGVARLAAPGARIEVQSAPATLALGEHLTDIVLEEFNGRRPELGAPDTIRVDGVEGRRVAFRVAQAPGASPLAGEAVYVPGSGRNYLLRFYAEGANAARRHREWTELLASIRLNRPWWRGS